MIIQSNVTEIINMNAIVNCASVKMKMKKVIVMARQKSKNTQKMAHRTKNPMTAIHHALLVFFHEGISLIFYPPRFAFAIEVSMEIAPMTAMNTTKTMTTYITQANHSKSGNS